jgi:hypothetical protein
MDRTNFVSCHPLTSSKWDESHTLVLHPLHFNVDGCSVADGVVDR